MKQPFLNTIWLACILLISCNKDDIAISNSDYLVFGHFYGMCIGEQCVEVFKLEKERLLEDTNDKYPNSNDFYMGNYSHQLSQQKFNETKDLIKHFPIDLLNETDIVIGQPDAGDWGGLYLEYNFNGIRKFWLLDQLKNNVPAKYHDFIDKVNEKITLLQ